MIIPFAYIDSLEIIKEKYESKQLFQRSTRKKCWNKIKPKCQVLSIKIRIFL